MNQSEYLPLAFVKQGLADWALAVRMVMGITVTHICSRLFKAALQVSIIFFTAAYSGMQCYALAYSPQLPTPVNRVITFSPPADTLKQDTLRLKALTIYTQRAPAMLQVSISAAQLSLSPAYSVADALTHAGGLQIKDYGGAGGLKTVDIRSLGSTHTGVYLDGVEVSNAQNGQADLSRFNLQDLESIQVYYAGRPAVLQPAKNYALANSVYLNTRQPDTTSHAADGSAYLRLGSFNTINAYAGLQQRIAPRWYLSGSSNTLNSAGHYQYRTPDTAAVRTNSDIFSQTTQLNTWYLPAPGRSLHIKAANYYALRGLPGPTLANRINYRYRLWQNESFLQSSYQRKYKAYSLLANAKLAYDYMKYRDPEIILLSGPLTNTYHQTSAYASLAHSLILNSHLTAGLSTDYQYNSLNTNVDMVGTPLRHHIITATTLLANYNRLSLQGVITNHNVINRRNGSTLNHYNRWLQPTLIAAYQLNNTTGLRAFYKSSYRQPTFNDVYYTLGPPAILKPEQAQQYNIGIAYSSHVPAALNIQANADAYYNRVTNKLMAIPTGSMQRWLMYNIGRVNITGLSTQTQLQYSHGKYIWGAGANYTWQHTADVTYNNHKNIPYAPAHNANLSLSMQHKTYSLAYTFTYTAPRYFNSIATAAYRLSAWYIHSCTAAWQSNTKYLPLKVTASADNIFNKQYQVVINYPMPGTQFSIAISTHFKNLYNNHEETFINHPAGP